MNVQLGNLETGKWRYLTAEEKKELLWENINGAHKAELKEVYKEILKSTENPNKREDVEKALKESENQLDKDDFGRSIVRDDCRIISKNNSYIYFKNNSEEILKVVNINQQNGIDTEDRIKKILSI